MLIRCNFIVHELLEFSEMLLVETKDSQDTEVGEMVNTEIRWRWPLAGISSSFCPSWGATTVRCNLVMVRCIGLHWSLLQFVFIRSTVGQHFTGQLMAFTAS